MKTNVARGTISINPEALHAMLGLPEEADIQRIWVDPSGYLMLDLVSRLPIEHHPLPVITVEKQKPSSVFGVWDWSITNLTESQRLVYPLSYRPIIQDKDGNRLFDIKKR